MLLYVNAHFLRILSKREVNILKYSIRISVFLDSEITVVDTAVAGAVMVPATVADSVVVSAHRVPIVADSIEDGKLLLSLCFDTKHQ